MINDFRCQSPVFGNCVRYSGDELDTTDCDLTVCEGEDYDSIIQDFYAVLCQLLSADAETDCFVKVSATDECCSYLQAKITNEDETVTIEKITDEETGCEVLDFSVANPLHPLEWIDLDPESPFIVGSIFQYSIDDYGNVRVRGTLSGDELNGGGTIIATLPLGFRPLTDGGIYSSGVINFIDENGIGFAIIGVDGSGVLTVTPPATSTGESVVVAINYEFNIN